MVYKNDGVSVADKVLHDTHEAFEILRMKTNGWLIKDIEDTRRSVPYSPSQLHPLPLSV